MIAARGCEPCYAFLIDSRTLRSENISLPLTCSIARKDHQFSIYSLVNRFSEINRRRFIMALNTNSCFECTVRADAEFTVRLHSTDCFGPSWSHVLTLYCQNSSFLQVFTRELQ